MFLYILLEEIFKKFARPPRMRSVIFTVGTLFAMRLQDSSAATQYSHCHIYSKNTAHCLSNATTASYDNNSTLRTLFGRTDFGLPVMLIYGVYITIFLYIVVSSLYKKPLLKQWVPGNQTRTYSLYLSVSRGCSLINKTIVQSGLSNLNAILVAHFKSSTSDAAFGILDVEGVIEEDDVLVFMSEIEMLPELMHFHGLVFTSMQVGLDPLFFLPILCFLPMRTLSEFTLLQDGSAEKDKIRSSVSIKDGRLIEAVVGSGSAAVGLRPDAAFRAAYGGFVVAVHRHGVPLLSHNSVALQAGDALLILTTDAILSTYAGGNAFSFVRLVTSYKQRWSLVPMLGMLALLLLIALSQFVCPPQFGTLPCSRRPSTA